MGLRGHAFTLGLSVEPEMCKRLQGAACSSVLHQLGLYPPWVKQDCVCSWALQGHCEWHERPL